MKKNQILICDADPSTINKFSQLTQYDGWKITTLKDVPQKNIKESIDTAAMIVMPPVHHPAHTPGPESIDRTLWACLGERAQNASETIFLCDPKDYSEIIVDTIYPRVTPIQKELLRQKALKVIERYS